MKIGILDLQGAVEPHEKKLLALGTTPVRVKYPDDLSGLSGIILPGGESSTMIHLLKLHHLWEPLKKFLSAHPCLGVCAGAILLSKEVDSPPQESLEIMNIKSIRNSYGRQIESFISWIQATEYWPGQKQVEGVFIRAPRFKVLDEKNVRTLFRHQEEPVFIEEGYSLAASFHPELSDASFIHEYFLNKCGANTHG